ncbi:hypothetical protein TUMEXPCC7403_08560 [Tumidithrix helvetica PCC 7403]
MMVETRYIAIVLLRFVASETNRYFIKIFKTEGFDFAHLSVSYENLYLIRQASMLIPKLLDLIP